MHRFLLAGLAWLLCLGSVTLYMHLRDDVRTTISAQAAEAPPATQARFDLELTLTFRAEADPFALADSDTANGGSVSLNGVRIIDLAEAVEPGLPRQTRLAGVIDGPNELLVQAAPPGGVGMNHAIRLRVFRNGTPMTEETFWSEGGGGILGTLHFENTDSGEEGHDH